MKTNWKVLAIVFISLFVIETISIILLFSLGYDVADKESECSINICKEQYDAYFYDAYKKVCYCYIDNQIVFEKYIGN